MGSEGTESAIRIEWIRTLGILGVALIGALGGWIVKGNQNADSGTTNGDEQASTLQPVKMEGEVRVTYFQDMTEKNWPTATCMEHVKSSLANSSIPYKNARKYGQGNEKYEDQINLNLAFGRAFVLCQRDSEESDNTVRIVAGLFSNSLTTFDIGEDPNWKSFIDALENVSKKK